MRDIEKVLASEEIGKFEAVHFRCVDSRDWDGYEAASAPDAVFGISRARPGCDLIGLDKIAEEAGGPLTRRVSVHCGLCQRSRE